MIRKTIRLYDRYIISFLETLEQTESPTVKFADDEAADSEDSAPSGNFIITY